MKNIYLIISHTGTLLSRIIRRLTGDKYTHASIGFEENLNEMYSFGRVYPRNPLIGGFVKESPHYGTMKRFRLADIVILKIPVPNEKFSEINDYITNMYRNRDKYHYNYVGLFLAKFGIHRQRKNHFYCSEFVKDILKRFDLVAKNEFNGVVRPAELLHMKRGEVIYRGKLCNYALTYVNKKVVDLN